jgi:hypothetical protein
MNSLAIIKKPVLVHLSEGLLVEGESAYKALFVSTVETKYFTKVKSRLFPKGRFLESAPIKRAFRSQT